MASLVLLHTADMHNRLSAAGAARLGELREENEALLLDGGDAVGAGNVTVRRSERIIDLMNQAGYAAMAVGNREYFFRKRGMIRKTQGAEFAVLSANLQAVHGHLGHIEPWTIVTTADGARVGIFGLTPTMIPAGSCATLFSDSRFVPWKRATQQVVTALNGQVDWLVALSHLGEEDDRELVESFSEIDIVLGGHSHPKVAQFEHLTRRLVCRPAPYAREALLVTISQTRANNHYETSVIELL